MAPVSRGLLHVASVCCRASFRSVPNTPSRQLSSSANSNSTSDPHRLRPHRSEPVDYDQLLARPTWSVRSLLPPAEAVDGESPEAITPAQLHHLLRLSALPLPKSQQEELGMIQMLQSQLHFVRDIQAVDTSGVKPLSAIRDETSAGFKEQTIGLAQLQHDLSCEVPFGRCKRPRRTHAATPGPAALEQWDVFQAAPERAGNYFVAKSHDPK